MFSCCLVLSLYRSYLPSSEQYLDCRVLRYPHCPLSLVSTVLVVTSYPLCYRSCLLFRSYISNSIALVYVDSTASSLTLCLHVRLVLLSLVIICSVSSVALFIGSSSSGSLSYAFVITSSPPVIATSPLWLLFPARHLLVYGIGPLVLH